MLTWNVAWSLAQFGWHYRSEIKHRLRRHVAIYVHDAQRSFRTELFRSSVSLDRLTLVPDYRSFRTLTLRMARAKKFCLLSPLSRKIGAPMVMELSSGTGMNSPRGKMRFILSI